MSDLISKDEIIEKLEKKLELKIKENGKLEEQLASKEKLFKKVGVITYLRCKIELYELVLSTFPPNSPLRNFNSLPPDLGSLALNFNDETLKTSFFLHYNRWYNILEYSSDPRMNAIINELRNLGFQSSAHFSRYIALLYIHLSNSIHNLPPDTINWENEDSVVSSLQSWQINDSSELNACRFLYRLPNIQ